MYLTCVSTCSSTSGILEMDGFWAYFDLISNSSELTSCGRSGDGAEPGRDTNYSLLLGSPPTEDGGEGSSCASEQSTDTGLVVVSGDVSLLSLMLYDERCTKTKVTQDLLCLRSFMVSFWHLYVHASLQLNT